MVCTVRTADDEPDTGASGSGQILPAPSWSKCLDCATSKAAAKTTAQPIVPKSNPASKARAQHPKAKGQVNASSKTKAAVAKAKATTKAKSKARAKGADAAGKDSAPEAVSSLDSDSD